MIKRMIRLDTIASVQEFNRICNNLDFDIDLCQSRYQIDAKSIMGIFSLNLENPLEMDANTDDEAMIEEKFGDYLIS